jgi:hypothetical protein
MRSMWGALTGAAVLAAGALVATGAATQRAPTGLATLQPGLWQLRMLDAGGTPTESICLADPNMMVQLQHRSTACSRLVLANDARGATVHYTCPTNGFGQTSVKVETPRLARIDTQGIRDNAPFAFRAEARRVGECAR